MEGRAATGLRGERDENPERRDRWKEGERRETVVIENLLATSREDCPRPLDKQSPTVGVERGFNNGEEKKGMEEKKASGKNAIEETKKWLEENPRGQKNQLNYCDLPPSRRPRDNNN